MDPVSVVLGGAPKALDFATKLAGAWRSHEDAREAELRLLRVLYFEVCQNLGVLERFHIADRAGIPSNDQAYSGVAKLLTVDAHLAVVLVRGETEAELASVRAQRLAAEAQREQTLVEQERAASEDAKRAERMAAFRAVWGDLCDESWELAGEPEDQDTEEDDGAARDRTPCPSKITTVLRSLAFVSVKVPTLQTLATVDEATRAVMRDLRTAVRLEQIRQHESALKRHLETLPGIAPVRV